MNNNIMISNKLLPVIIMIISCITMIVSLIYVLNYYPMDFVFRKQSQFIIFVAIFAISMILYTATIKYLFTAMKSNLKCTIMILLIIVVNVIYIAYFSHYSSQIEMIDPPVTWYLMAFPAVLASICMPFLRKNIKSTEVEK